MAPINKYTVLALIGSTLLATAFAGSIDNNANQASVSNVLRATGNPDLSLIGRLAHKGRSVLGYMFPPWLLSRDHSAANETNAADGAAVGQGATSDVTSDNADETDVVEDAASGAVDDVEDVDTQYDASDADTADETDVVEDAASGAVDDVEDVDTQYDASDADTADETDVVEDAASGAVDDVEDVDTQYDASEADIADETDEAGYVSAETETKVNTDTDTDTAKEAAAEVEEAKTADKQAAGVAQDVASEAKKVDAK